MYHYFQRNSEELVDVKSLSCLQNKQTGKNSKFQVNGQKWWRCLTPTKSMIGNSKACKVQSMRSELLSQLFGRVPFLLELSDPDSRFCRVFWWRQPCCSAFSTSLESQSKAWSKLPSGKSESKCTRWRILWSMTSWWARKTMGKEAQWQQLAPQKPSF